MAIGHAQRFVFVAGKRTRVTPLPDGHFLHPSDGVESPHFQIRSDRFRDPSKCAAAVLLSPDVDVLGITQARWVDVVETDREKRSTVWRDQPPVFFPAAKREIAFWFRLRGIRRSRLGKP